LQHLSLRDGQRRSKGQDVVHRRFEREPAIEGGIQGRLRQVIVGLHTIAIAHQLDAKKWAAAPHITDHGDLELVQALECRRPDLRRVLYQAIVLDDLNGGKCRTGCDRVFSCV